VQGGKRPRSSMSPTIVLQNGKPLLVVGSPGGSMIITTVLQILVDRLDLGLTLPQAIADPRSRRGTLRRRRPSRVPGHARGGGPPGARPRLQLDAGDRRGDRHRVPVRGKLLAAAEPVRRGSGSAMVVTPTP
jgi:gamma-glutamyltranspeptidase/glutathione hydrolase